MSKDAIFGNFYLLFYNYFSEFLMYNIIQNYVVDWTS